MALTQEQIEQFKTQLDTMKRDVYKRYQKREQNVDTEEITSNENHMGDSATVEYEHEKELTLKESDEELLEEINQALERIEKGTFGICIDTGEDISKERLEAVPYAKRTIEAQRAYDKRKTIPDEHTNDRRRDTSNTIEQIEEEQNASGR
ncbi:TraR/DksA family transcriptional regulator [Pseudalkalibacillus sp. Hm43]|uniref:TraR/DksA family transcriptional regulator n=1 Tax=Pseudalkalibacillus sp. Hm43 TaxID=3450742 RepID=UPI003F421175